MKLSIVIPAKNEAENIFPLYKEITEVLRNFKGGYELIFVSDGSHDLTWAKIKELHALDDRVHGIQFGVNFGKAAALQAGFDKVNGEIVIQMDADLQDDPAEIPHFIKKLDEGYDMVVGWKHKRLDSFVKNKTSRLFNGATNVISGVKLHDHNCGYKAYRAEVVKSLHLYGELHRYIAVLAGSSGYSVGELPVNHRVRNAGKSKYGPMRFIHGFLDLLTVLFITKFRTRPLHLFGYLGIMSFMLGFLIGIYLTYIKLIGHQSIGDRPLLLFSVMLMIMGVQIGVTGLVGEQITTLVQKNEKSYVIKNTL